MKRLIVLILVLMMCLPMAVHGESATASLHEIYTQAELLMAQGNYDQAAVRFEALGAYLDASQLTMYCKAISAAENHGLHLTAVDAFEALGDFKDSKQMARYYKARAYQDAGAINVRSANNSAFDKAIWQCQGQRDHQTGQNRDVEVLGKNLIAVATTTNKGDLLYGLANAKGKVLVKPGAYDMNPHEAYGLVSIKKKDGKRGVLDANNYKKVLVPFEFTDISITAEGKAVYAPKEKRLISTETGRDIIEPGRYAAIVTSQESSTFAAVRNGGWYILDLEGNEIY